MSSFLWMLLYLAPLLGLTAAVFGWLGWRWSGSDLKQRIRELEDQLRNLTEAERTAEKERDAAQAQILTATAEAASIIERREGELIRLRDETAKAKEACRTLDAEINRLQAELDTAQEEIANLRSVPPVETPVELVGPTAPEGKPKRKRTAASTKPVTALRGATLEETIAALEDRLFLHESNLADLFQERDAWQGRVSTLESETTADPAGLALAYRSLTDSEQRLLATSAEIERLKSQTAVLKKVGESAASLDGIPSDDLTRIKGIKNVISDLLHAHGIRTWCQIALWNDDELRAFSELLAFKNRATREKWREQARALHESAHGPLT